MADSELKGMIGRRIREEREARGMTQGALAAALGIAAARLCRIEKGQRGVDTLVLRRAVQVFEVPMGTLFEQPQETAPARHGRDGAAMQEMLDYARRLQRLGALVERESRAHA